MHRQLFPAACVMALLLVAGCSSDPTTSDEYAALETERNELADQVESFQTEKDQLAEEVAALQTEVEGLQTEVEALESENETLGDTRDEAEAELAALEAREATWPQEFKEAIVQDCASEPEPGLSDEQNEALCRCVADQLEDEFSLTEFFTFFMPFYLAPEDELDPLTGLPPDIPPDLAMSMAEIGAFCFFEISGTA